MKNLLFVIALIGGMLISAFSQVTPSNPPGPGETQKQMQESRERDIQANQRVRELQNPRLNPQYDIDRHKYDGMPRVVSTGPGTIIKINAISSKLSKEQSKLILPNPEDSTKYAAFLKKPNTGLIKLFPDLGCLAKGIVRVDGICENSIASAALTSYSFRKKYHLANSDISLKDNTFAAQNWFSNGIITMLGDIPIESLSINSNGIKFLSDYKPANNNIEVLFKTKELSNGIQDGDFTYSNLITALENTTYAIRVIAYQGKIKMPFRDGVGFNLLENDKRVDILVVFRVVRKESNGTLTLLWKELQRKDSPKINLSKEEQEIYIGASKK